MDVSPFPASCDYDEPKTAFLILVKRLAFEGYTYGGVRHGLQDALFELTNRQASGLEWRGLFEELGDGAAFLDLEECEDLGGFDDDN